MLIAILLERHFSRAGHIDCNPSWTIQSEHHTLIATWEQLESPLVGPPTINLHIVFTVLVFAAAGQMQLDGMAVPGRPYPLDAWSKSLGQARSSCCFALAEYYGGRPKVRTSIAAIE